MKIKGIDQAIFATGNENWKEVPWPTMLCTLIRDSCRSIIRLTMAKPEEVFAVTGYHIGAVSPIGLKTAVPIYIDNLIMGQEEISIGSGIRGTAVMIAPAWLPSVIGTHEIVELS